MRGTWAEGKINNTLDGRLVARNGLAGWAKHTLASGLGSVGACPPAYAGYVVMGTWSRL